MTYIYIDHLVHEFLTGLRDCRSVDCVLVKLSSAICSISDFAETFQLNVRELVDKFLSHPDVVKALVGLVRNLQDVEEKIQSDVRFKNLQPYLSSILNVIRQALQQTAREPSVHTEVSVQQQVQVVIYPSAPSKPQVPVDDYVSKFVAGVEDCRSVDCVLTKLSTAFLSMSDHAKSAPHIVQERELVNAFLSHPDVMKVLAGLASNLEYVEAKIRSDARFGNLRPYQSEILDAIRKACESYVSPRIYDVYERPPTWRVESIEHEYRRLPVLPPPKDYTLRKTIRIPVIGEDEDKSSARYEVKVPREFKLPFLRRARWKRAVKAIAIVAAVVVLLWILALYLQHWGSSSYSQQSVPIKELATNPEKYVDKEVVVEGILSLIPAEFYLRFCPGGNLKTDVDTYNLIEIVDTSLEYSIFATKPPDSHTRYYHYVEYWNPVYVYRFHGVLRRYSATCCTYEVDIRSGLQEKCGQVYVYILEITSPGEVVKVIERR